MSDFYFLRITPVDLLRYLPKFLKNDEAFKDVQDTLSWMHEQQRIRLINIAKQFFVDTATWGLSDWEAFVGIDTNTELSDEARRIAIKIKLNRPPSVTVQFLESLANNYLSDNSAHIIEHNDEYWFELEFNLDALQSLTGIREAINLYKPAHLGFLIAFKILSRIQIKQQVGIVQYIDAMHNFWNLGTAESTHWDGAWYWDGSIDWSGIKPDTKYKERQSHVIDILAKVNSLQCFNTKQNAEITYKTFSKHSLLTSHKMDSIYYVGIDLKQNIKNKALNTEKISAKQSRTTGNEKNLWDGSFCWDGSHAWEGDYTLQNAQMENLCTCYSTDKSGNIRKGSFERL